MIIDKDFPGLIDCGGWYKLERDLITDEDTEIKIPLEVGGSMWAMHDMIAKFL